MQHDFFGNKTTDAYSDLAKLNLNKATTCNVTADASAYWAPQLKRAAGIVVPDFQKTYYRKDTALPLVTAIPQGLEMLAGDHHGTAANPAVSFFCANKGYTGDPPTSCPVVNGNAQLDIVVYFPDCWDGEHIKPDFSAGVQNMTYHNKDGSCPEAYPIKIQQLEMNIQYTLGNNGDLNGAQLSMDPIMVNGVLTPQWGSLYTAHADFINAWKPDSMQYATDVCSNNGDTACSNNIPTYYSPATADTWLDAAGTPHNGDQKLRVGPGDIIFMKFPTPTNTTEYPYASAGVQTQGGNVSNSSAVYLYVFAAATNWDDANTPPTVSACTSQSVGAIYLDNVNQLRVNGIDSYVKQQIASKAPETAICIKNNTSNVVEFNSREMKTGVPALFLK
ncbi:putative exported protein [Caballeronia insecticola]|uniref:Putative exported protein n=2 Tax=Caballeronia insecticola TaxID=758793 RepID=R4WZR4_9BURK|nr:putative exported protein [Caballeronia insecticola]